MKLALLAAAVAAVLGCQKLNPNYCDEDHPCPGGATCDPVDHSCPVVDAAPPTCGSNDDCAATPGTPYCDVTGTGTCRPCGPGGPSACAADTPVCNEDELECEACADDTDCPSGACLPSGACAAAGAVLFVTPTGGTTDCSSGAPCSVARALMLAMPARNVIHFATGSYTPDTIAVPVNELTVVGATAGPVTITSAAANDAPAMQVGSGKTLHVYRLAVTGADGTAAGDGLACLGGAVDTDLATFASNDHYQISATNCQLAVARSTIGGSGTGGGGVFASGGSLTLTRSKVLQTPNGGVEVHGASAEFTIVNNLWYQAGGAGAPFGAVRLQDITSTTGQHVFEFNTIKNCISTNVVSSAVAGLNCTGTANYMFRNNIIYDNQPRDLDPTAVCTHSFTVFKVGDPGAGVNNLMTEPHFVSSDDFHLLAPSPGLADGAENAAIDLDLDGHARPNPVGSPPDRGAFESP